MNNQSIHNNMRVFSVIFLAAGLVLMLFVSISLDARASVPAPPPGDPWGGNANLRFNQFIPSLYAQSGASGDVDGDGDLDLITSSCGGNTLVLHNDGDGNFTTAQTFPFPSLCHVGIVVGDLDDDTYPDALLFDHELNDNRVLWNNDDGSGTFTDGGSASWSDRDGFAALADLDGDDDLDVFVVAGLLDYVGNIRTWENDGDGNFSLMDEFDTAYKHTGLALGYLDDDTYLDAFTTSWGNGYNKVWLNDGTGAFTEHQSIPGANSYGVVLGDLDDDGDLDAYLANITDSWVNLPDEVWFNDGDGFFVKSAQIINAASTAWPGLGDLDGDFDLDVYISSSPLGNVGDEIWVNDGSGIFSLRRTLAEHYAGAGGGLGDIDNDGDLDAFSVGIGQGYLVLKNGDWRQAAQLSEPVAAYGYAQCPDQPNNFYIIGGSTSIITATADVWLYAVDTDSWTSLAPLPDAEGLLAPPAVCYAGHIYVVAGPLQVYDIAADTWTIMGSIPRFAGGAGVGAWNGKIYRVGGVMGYYYDPPYNHVDVYDIATGTWELDGGTPAPQAVLLPGYTQVGQYLYLVGGTGIGSPAQNVSILQRYDMASDTWEQVGFPSARGLGLTLAHSGHTLYAIGGDTNGGGYFDITDLVETYDLSTWPAGTWEVYTDTYPYPVLGNTAGFCSEVKTGGEIWSVSGSSGTLADPELLHANSYHATGEACVSYGVDLPASVQGHGFANSTVNYSLSITNTGNITDYFTLEISTPWGGGSSQVELGPVAPGEAVQVVISVDIPAGAKPGEIGLTAITVNSHRDPGIADSMQISTAVWQHLLLPLAMKN